MTANSSAIRFSAREITRISIFAASIAVLTQVVIPIGPVPVSFGIFGVMLCGAILPLKLSLTTIFVYLLLGAFGAPVFTQFQGGFHKLAGPTGGYLFGYIALILVVGLLDRKKNAGVVRLSCILTLGAFACYALGTAWLAAGLGYTFRQAFMVGVAPFIAADMIKAVAAATIGRRVRTVLRRG